jgi:hypothetical protein
MGLTPLDLISAHPWQRVAFTTYALSLSFFEAVILDALARGGGSAHPVVLADIHGVRGSLSEQGAHSVGRAYEVEPVAVSGGVFHPKITVLTADKECHLLVGSGNLTFNGWGGNCEVIEHLHPGFAPDAIADAAEFFMRLPRSSRVRQAANRDCAEIAFSLGRAVEGRPRNGEIRFLHNLETPLTDQIAQAAADLGGARRLIAAAPFWDSGSALDHLCRTLGVNEAHLHVHAKGTAEGTLTDNWPRRARIQVRAVRIASLDAPSEAQRRLHAKAFEILCQRGRLLISGSANGTSAALGRDGNIEACVLRVQRKFTSAWTWVPAEPPELQSTAQDDSEDELSRVGVLRAVLEGDQLIGQVLAPRMSGAVSIYHLAPVAPERLGQALLDCEGQFRITAPDLENSLWRGGRLVLRLIDTAARQAEGFISLASFAEIARRGGAMSRRLFAIISRTETPEDVAAILSWFLEDPKRLSGDPEGIRGRGESREDKESEELVPIEALDTKFPELPPGAMAGGPGERHWSRFIDQVLAAFREAREPFEAGDSDDDDEDTEPKNTRKQSRDRDVATDKAYGTFRKLFELLTGDGSSARNAEVAFDLTGFMCARLRPDLGRARTWLVSVIRTWLNAGVRAERHEDVAAAILTVLGTAPETERTRWARSSLLQLGRDLSAPPPPAEVVLNYQTVLLQREGFPELWRRVCQVRTYEEQVQAYVRALERGAAAPGDAYPDLPVAAADAWPVLAQALRSSQARARVLFVKGRQETCPVDHMILPKHELEKLRTIGIATAKNCCGRIVIRKEA